MAWNFVAILVNGATMVNVHDLPAKVIANLTIWLFLLYGLYFLASFGDYTIGFEMSWLSLGKLALSTV